MSKLLRLWGHVCFIHKFHAGGIPNFRSFLQNPVTGAALLLFYPVTSLRVPLILSWLRYFLLILSDRYFVLISCFGIVRSLCRVSNVLTRNRRCRIQRIYCRECTAGECFETDCPNCLYRSMTTLNRPRPLSSAFSLSSFTHYPSIDVAEPLLLIKCH